VSGGGSSVTSENVTVLFTDMVGSTALLSSLGPDNADELRRAQFAILRQAAAEAGGIEVKNLGDGLMVVFRAASAAFRARSRCSRASTATAVGVSTRWDCGLV
jgi:class 3 adenylate cyclase